MRGEEPPEDGYEGDYVAELRRALSAEGVDPPTSTRSTRRGDRADAASGCAATLERFRVHFDRCFSERSLHEAGRASSAAIERARASAATSTTAEGAIWLRTTQFGDDKDRVLRRSTGELTYFAADIAYHQDKRERGFDRLIDVLGRRPPRLRAADAGGVRGARGEPGPLRDADHAARPHRRARRARADVQAQRRVRHARRADRRHRRRRGALLHAPALARHDVDLDLDLARERSQENPVYYVQYAHARIAGILRKAGEERVERARCAPTSRDGRAALEPAERALVKRLLELPGRGAPRRPSGARRTGSPPTRIELAAGLPRLLPRLPGGRRRAAELEDFRLR